jgi:hypothetical protein
MKNRLIMLLLGVSMSCTYSLYSMEGDELDNNNKVQILYCKKMEYSPQVPSDYLQCLIDESDGKDGIDPDLIKRTQDHQVTMKNVEDENKILKLKLEQQRAIQKMLLHLQQHHGNRAPR